MEPNIPDTDVYGSRGLYTVRAPLGPNRPSDPPTCPAYPLSPRRRVRILWDPEGQGPEEGEYQGSGRRVGCRVFGLG